MNAARVELLQQMPIFGAVAAEALTFLVDAAPTAWVRAGDYFFHEGEAPTSMFVIEAGRVIVSRRWQEREMLVRRFGPGDCFGEMALLDLYPRSASVRAEADCTAIELAPDNLLRLFEHDAEQFALIQMNIAREMSRRLRLTDELLFRARMGDAPPAPEGLGAPT